MRRSCQNLCLVLMALVCTVMFLYLVKEKIVFYDESSENGLSETASHFIAGVLKHARSFTAICNPTVNSYKRLVPGYEAPCYVAWSTSNRSPLVRVPAITWKLNSCRG